MLNVAQILKTFQLTGAPHRYTSHRASNTTRTSISVLKSVSHNLGWATLSARQLPFTGHHSPFTAQTITQTWHDLALAVQFDLHQFNPPQAASSPQPPAQRPWQAPRHMPPNSASCSKQTPPHIALTPYPTLARSPTALSDCPTHPHTHAFPQVTLCLWAATWHPAA